MNAKKHSDWVDDVLSKVRKHVNSRRYKITNHAEERQHQYNVTLPDLLFVLSTGFHEKDKTLFDNTFQTWKYAIRGKTLDGLLDLRIIIAFQYEMAVITVVRLNKRK
jgi:hypothetical protein